MKKFFDKVQNRLVFIEQSADSAYWDQHWKTDDRSFSWQLKNVSSRLVLRKTKKYLFPEAKILDGGCGRGSTIYSLHYHGYDVYGIDYAKETVKKINQYSPELKVQFGDIRQLPFPDKFFDGYWSLRVIEHFYEGYNPVILEMQRVLKHGGYLFVTIPVISLLRKLKSKLGLYPVWHNSKQEVQHFYQFAFNPKATIGDLENKGFKLVEIKPYDGIKGLKDEVFLLRPLLQYLYDRNNISSKVIRKTLDIMVRHFTNHMCLFVVRKV